MMQQEVESNNKMLKNKLGFNIKEWSITVAFGIIVVFLTILSPYFMTVNNIRNILLQSSNIMLISIGLTFILICGQMDLSLGSVEALSGSLVAVALVNIGIPLPISIILALVGGMLCGIVCGLLVSYCKFAPFIATLAMQSMSRGIGLIITNGAAVFGFPESFKFIGQGRIWIIPVPVIIFTVMIIIANIVLKHTRFGANVYAVGSNEQAALLSGINVKAVKITVFTISGFMAAMAGILMASRLNSGQATIGEYDVMDAVASVVIGGTSMRGGVGKIRGTLIGVLIICTIRNGLNIMAVSAYWQQVAIGFIIIVAIMIDLFSKGKTN
jgi:ribose/xylose/arabinose/galactoside ABC-type transport system permease subunit